MLAFTVALSLLAQNPFADDQDVHVQGSKERKAPATVKVSGKVTEWVGGGPTTSPTEKPLAGVTVVIGDVNFNTGTAGADTVKGKPAAKVTTNDKGEWTANVPAGKHSIVLWKAGYTPATDSLTAPGTHSGSISVDKQGQGLHRTLSFN